MFSVLLKHGHPTGVYHRAGLVFSASAPTLLETVPDAVRKDPWLSVSDADPNAIAAAAAEAPKIEGESATPILDLLEARSVPEAMSMLRDLMAHHVGCTARTGQLRADLNDRVSQIMSLRNTIDSQLKLLTEAGDRIQSLEIQLAEAAGKGKGKGKDKD